MESSCASSDLQATPTHPQGIYHSIVRILSSS
jgi:hypothetical protein